MITQQELSKYFNLIGMNFSQKDLDDIYQRVDLNTDSNIGWIEFRSAMLNNLSLIKTKSSTDYNRPLKPIKELDDLFTLMDTNSDN